MNPAETFILTKIHSLENEGLAKVKWIREQGVLQSIILVPFLVKKTDMVDACGNILVDDCLKNLSEWVKDDGIPIFFDMDDDGYDSWHQPNLEDYPKILSLSKFK